jgi:hypothetical protein
MSNHNGTGPTLDEASRAITSSTMDCRTLFRTLKESIRKADDECEEIFDLDDTDDLIRRMRAAFQLAKPVIESNVEILEKCGSLESPIKFDRTSRSAHIVAFEMSLFVEMASGSTLYGDIEMKDALEQQHVIERYLRWVNPGIPPVEAIDWLLGKLTDERETLSKLGLLPRYSVAGKFTEQQIEDVRNALQEEPQSRQTKTIGQYAGIRREDAIQIWDLLIERGEFPPRPRRRRRTA